MESRKDRSLSATVCNLYKNLSATINIEEIHIYADIACVFVLKETVDEAVISLNVITHQQLVYPATLLERRC